MSSHSRSSSDSDKISLKDILPIYLQDFLKDFSFCDVVGYVRQRRIFTDEDLSKILEETVETKQNILLFFILIDKPHIIEDFLGILKIDYNWLSEKVLNTHHTIGNKEITHYLHAVHELKSNFPKHSDYNVHRLKHYCNIREHLLKLRSHNYLIIDGELGMGKKWLALDACCDFAVMKRMGFKVFWIDVHNCDLNQEKILEILQRLKILLGDASASVKKIGDYEGISNKILELQQDIRSTLKEEEYKNCLLVLSNVREAKIIEEFKLNCKILIVTRIKDFTNHISSALYKTVHIDTGFTQSEYADLFEKILKKPKETFPVNSNDLLYHSKGNPFILNMIAQNLRDHNDKEWTKWIRNLCNVDIADEIVNIIQLSLNVLSDEEVALYKTLAIFVHSFKIPVKVLAAYWNRSEHQAAIIVKKFDKFSLVNIDSGNDNSMTCCIHFLYHSYLKKCTDIDKRALHRALIRSYKIENALNNRNEFDLIELPNDNYFHFYIGYHLWEANMTEYFSKLYLDFGFLGQMLRATGLPNTIGDLKYYRNQITGKDEYKVQLLNSLLEFLPNIEEMIFRSNDTYLIQYALLGNGLLHNEALKQAKQFPNKIWIFDGECSYASNQNGNLNDQSDHVASTTSINQISSRGHFHRRRQMISLPGKPKSLKLIEPDTCLIALEDHMMLLADIYLGYNLEPTKFVGHVSDIIEIDSFAENNVISLDRKGEIRVWSIADERRRNIERKQSNRLIVNHIDFAKASQMRKKECIQTITKHLNGEIVSVQHFHIDNYSEHPHIYLHLAFSNGDICVYLWNDNIRKFEQERIKLLQTRIQNIQFMMKLYNFYIVVNNDGVLMPYYTRDGSSCATSFMWPKYNNKPIRIHHFRKKRETIVIFVFEKKVLQVNFPAQTFDFLKGDLTELYVKTDDTTITCSCLSDDNKYLIIGSNRGIIVFDTHAKSEVLRNSIGETIVCIDIYSLDDDIYKYVIVSGSEGHEVLNIFGLKMNSNQSITWANSIGTLGKETNLNPQFEPNAWLVGKQLFDVNFYENSSAVVAVDSKNRIHQMTIENKNWSLIRPDLNSKITAITASDHNDDYYFGCDNGKIYKMSNLSDEIEMETNFFTKSITFLKLINPDILIASSKETRNCVIYSNNIFHKFQYDPVNANVLFDKYLVLWDSKCNIMVLDITDNFKILDKTLDKAKQDKHILGGSDYRSNVIIMGTIHSEIYVYRCFDEQKLEIRPFLHGRIKQIPITCISISADTNYCAVGLITGKIEIYKIETQSLRLIQKLKSHRSPIYDMKFSPWTHLNAPLILVSSSEQICFWDINYVINNPLDAINNKDRYRRSSRFNSTGGSNSSSTLNLDYNHADNQIDGDISLTDSNLFITNLWLRKTGASHKPELLSCIKYAGTKAEKFCANDTFTKFITIDDEGEYYLLNIQDILFNNSKTIHSAGGGDHHYRQLNGNNNGDILNNYHYLNGNGDHNLIDDDVII